MNIKNTDKEILLEEWKVCVEMANCISQRRDTVNNLFITLNIALITMISISWNLKSIILICAGIISSVIWLILIRNYRFLNSEKYKIINRIEECLPIQPFNEEWNGLTKEKSYIDSTIIECIFTGVFIVIYLVLGLIIIMNY